MNRIILSLITLILSSSSFAQNGQIENGGFENWLNETVYEKPEIWRTSNDTEFFGTSLLTKSTDANDGNYSAKFESKIYGTDTLTSYVLHGEIGNNGPEAGIPYDHSFEAFAVDFKGDLQPDDTLKLLMIRYLNGSIVDFQIKPILYGTQSTWTTSIIFVGNQPQDSLFFGFILGDPVGNAKPHPSSSAQIDNVRLLSGGVFQPNLPNHSFEDWTDQTTENSLSWNSINYLLTGTNNENVTKSTDSNTGQYAVQLETILRGNDTIVSYLSSGVIDFYNGGFGLIPYSASPTNLSGSYKYTSINGSVGELSVLFYQAGTPIGYHSEIFTNQSTYTNFNAVLSLAGIPDSIIILANSGDYPGATLLLDDLSFSGGNVNLDELLSVDYQMYPNPANEILTIRLPDENNFNVSIMDVNGKEMFQIKDQSGVSSINIQQLEAGVYFVNVSNDFSKETKKLVVQ